ncbi:MAG: xanthine dehydrogenase family protein [Deltaproteobacteria bacterium]|nr:xanthine dehydrogenase family protein [Deltaproteobacteria bacterium]
MAARFVGARIKRREDRRLITGEGAYVADLARPGMVHAAILRSPYARARIRAVDLTAARQSPGVLLALAFEDLQPAGPLPLPVPHPALKAAQEFPLAPGMVHYVGEPVAVVVAEERYAAEDALDLIRVEYEPLPPVVDPERALAADAPLVHEELGTNVAAHLEQETGDVERAFREADHVFRERFRVLRGSGQSIEARAVLAAYDPLLQALTVWSSTQTPHLIRRGLAPLLNLTEAQIRIIAPDVGGGFGSKGVFYPEEFLVPFLAIRLGRPVKWVEDRREHLQTAIQERGQVHEVEVAVRRDGRILAVRDRFVADQGAYTPWGIVVPVLTATMVPGPYKIPNYRFEVTVVYTNTVPSAPVRGAGRPQAVFVMERMVDRVARELGLDPAEVRFRNFIPPHEFPYVVGLRSRDGRLQTYDSGNYPEGLTRALRLIGYEEVRKEQERLRAEARYLGVGMACCVEATGLGPHEGATVRVDPSGRVYLYTGASPQGQGHETMLAQVCADALGVELEEITVVTGDTAGIPQGTGTFASRIATVAANAVTAAATEVRARALRAGAYLLEARVEDLDLISGRVQVRGVPEKGVPLGQVARVAAGAVPGPGSPMPEGVETSLEATSYFTPAQAAYASGTHAAVVEVDVETGMVKVLKYGAIHDCGRMINPMIVEGQVCGGVAHGIGNALLEEPVYDGSGQLLTSTFMDYLLPSAAEVPEILLDHVETLSPLNPLGVKGAGEGGTIPAPAAIAAAVEDALAPFGVRITEVPLSPERLRRLISRGERAQDGGRG